MSIKTVVSQCNGCIRVMKDGTCLGYENPEFQWRFGECNGYDSNKSNLFDIYYSIKRYGGSEDQLRTIKKHIEKVS